MGQAYSMTTLSAASATIDVPELSDLTHEKTLASARFMKSIRARSAQGFVFVKAVMKPYSAFDIRGYVKQITEERNLLARIPNVLGYQRIVEVSSGGFLVRQYIFSSVYDRLSTRPFLEDIEKRWLAFQLLSAVRDCHMLNLYHGDIKTENLLVTSWNWLYLSDFSAAFKPTQLPEDNPADFTFYFDTSSRRICYVAPERFISATSEDAPDELNWAMDMFSVGCAIAEMFLEGPIFTLSQIFKYKTGDYSPEHAHINKIDDPEVRAMILNMIDLDPEKRYSAEQHLAFYKAKIFPEYFYSFLHDYMRDLTESSAEATPLTLENQTFGESDSKIERLHHDFDKISYFLGHTATTGLGSPKKRRRLSTAIEDPFSKSIHQGIVTDLSDGTLLFLTIVTSSIRNTSKASARLKACDLLVSFAERLPDEAKLDRILPYIVGLLNDRSDMVKVTALNAVTTVLESVEVVSPINAFLFPEYIFPKLRLFLTWPGSQPSALVRAAYASCLASLALSSTRILDMVQAIRADGRLPAFSHEAWAPEASFHGLYDVARAELVPHFEEATTSLITDPDPSVRRALLGSVSRLCVFFGSSKASDVILSHLNTYLNDKDWILRCSFYDALVGVASYVGTSSLEQFIVPVMIGSLTDSEAFVVEKVLRSLSRMAALGLFQRSTTWNLLNMASRFLVHPSLWVSEAAVQFTVQAAKYLTPADKYCILLPILQPFLKIPIFDFSEQTLLDSLISPLPKSVFDAAVIWAAKKEKSLFWTCASRDGVFALPNSDDSIISSAVTRRLTNRIPPSQKDKDDPISLDTLKNFGMTSEDEIKLLALREYILKVATERKEASIDQKQQLLGNIVSLAQIDVTLQNVFFDQVAPYRPVTNRSRTRSKTANRQESQRTLADALLDASTTLDDTGRLPSSRPLSEAPTPPNPIEVQGVGRKFSEAGEPSSLDRPRNRLQSIQAEVTGRSSSVGARHRLLDSERLSSSRNSGELKHRGSAVSLLKRAEGAKAGAEISTTPENAFGKLDGSTFKRAGTDSSMLSASLDAVEKGRAKSPLSNASSGPSYEGNHSYSGNDPTVIRLLDNHLTENFAIDLLDFGPQVSLTDHLTSIRKGNEIAVIANPQPNIPGAVFRKEPWQPTGQLLAQFAEHTATINRVVAAPDHAFFVTASDDGSVKLWDTTRLEKNVTARSRYTHRHAPGTKVKSLCFIEDTHTFVSGASDGSIHAVRVEYKLSEGGESVRYGKPVLVRDFQIPMLQPTIADGNHEIDGLEPSTEHAVWLYHYRNSTSKSILLVATDRSRLLFIDMKNMEVLHVLHNPVHHGTPTTFCVDKRHHWLLVGTSNGILDLWDLRFRLRIRAFGIGGTGLGKRIDRLLLHPTKGHGRWIISSCGGELSIWDIEKMVCREVLRPCTFVADNSKETKSYETWSPDDEAGQKILQRFARDVATNENALEPSLKVDSNPADTDRNGSERASGEQPSTRASMKTSSPEVNTAYVLIDYLLNAAQPENPNKSAIILSAGADRTIRYWDLAQIEKSMIVSGPMLNVVGEENKIKTRYETSFPTSMSLSGLVQLVEERLSEANINDGRDGGGSAKNTPKKRRGNPTSSNKGNTSSKMPRNTLISLAQQQLLRTHMDTITDICLLRKPYGCIVSVDKGGCIYIFH